MVRSRSMLLSHFPPGTITPEQASQALREASGDVEQAKEALKKACVAVANKNTTTTAHVTDDAEQRRPPAAVAVIHILSDRRYCCVWSVEVYEDGYRPEVARALLAQVARHVNPVLRDRGWRVKRLIESTSTQWIGCCTGNGRSDADAASTNIQLNLRVNPSKHCRTFRSFAQILAVMLHEITHTSIGLADIHPPAFYDLLEEIRGEYRTKLASGEVDRETDAYGCNETFVTASGEVTTIGMAARDIVNTVDSAKTITNNSEDTSTTPLLLVDSSDCGVQKRRKGRRRQRRGGGGGQKRSHVTALGMHAALANEKRRPLLKGVKMIDKRTIQGKKSAAETVSLSARELAARAALARLGQNPPLAATAEIVWKTTETDFAARTFVGRNAEHKNDSHDEEDESNFEDSSGVEEENETIRSHVQECACRSCEWDRMLFIPTANG